MFPVTYDLFSFHKTAFFIVTAVKTSNLTQGDRTNGGNTNTYGIIRTPGMCPLSDVPSTKEEISDRKVRELSNVVSCWKHVPRKD
jgi:hypothetical protein